MATYLLFRWTQCHYVIAMYSEFSITTHYHKHYGGE